MEFPLIDRHLLANLKLVHGLFNAGMMCLFVYHGRNGLLARRARRRQLPLPFMAIRRHRRLGPILAALGAAGFCVGLTLVFLDTGQVWRYPLHLLTSSLLMLLIGGSFLTAKRIAGANDRWRHRHFCLGIAVLSCYIINVVIGLGVLL